MLILHLFAGQMTFGKWQVGTCASGGVHPLCPAETVYLLIIFKNLISVVFIDWTEYPNKNQILKRSHPPLSRCPKHKIKSTTYRTI